MILPLLLMLCASLPSHVGAEKWDERVVRLDILPEQVYLPPLYGKVQGKGYLNYANWTFNVTTPQSVDVNVQVAVAVLPENTNENLGDEKILESVGIGKRGNDGVYYYCCSEQAQSVNACTKPATNTESQDSSSSANGRGSQWSQPVSYLITSGEEADKISISNILIPKGSMGHPGHIAMAGVKSYGVTTHTVVLVANCSPYQSGNNHVIVQGHIIWTSYIATNSLPFVLLVTGGHLGLVVWYRALMAKNQSSRIRLEEWIFGTMVLALVSMVFTTILYTIEATSDWEVIWFRVLSDWLSTFKAVVSRCLYVMLALGWGVTTPTLGRGSMNWIYLLGGTYQLAQMIIVTTDDNSGGSRNRNNDQWAWLGNLVSFITFIFMVWIPVALHRTMRVLSVNGEVLKLQRFKWMFRIYFLSIFLKLVLVFLFFWDMIKDGGREFDLMSITVGDEFNFLVIVACMAYLWRPNPDATKYGYVLLEDDGEILDGNRQDNKAELADLELTEMNQRNKDEQGDNVNVEDEDGKGTNESLSDVI